MTRDEFAAALEDGAFALRYCADRLRDLAGTDPRALDRVREYRAHADLLTSTNVRAVAHDTWGDFERDARALARALPPPPMLEQS